MKGGAGWTAASWMGRNTHTTGVSRGIGVRYVNTARCWDWKGAACHPSVEHVRVAMATGRVEGNEEVGESEGLGMGGGSGGATKM